MDQIKKFLESYKSQAIVYGKFGSNSFQIRTKLDKQLPVTFKVYNGENSDLVGFIRSPLL